MSVIALQPHQRALRNHVVKTCCKQPGIVLYHAVGTGKTLTALSIAMSMPTMPCVVFSPPELEFMWDAELKRVGTHGAIVVRTFNDMTKYEVSGKLVIVDEAHMWIQMLHSDSHDDRQRAKDMYENLKRAKKRILLTGSPICNPLRGLFDIGCLCNVAAGKELFPFSQPAFRKKYSTTNIALSLTVGWIGWIAHLKLTVMKHILGYTAGMLALLKLGNPYSYKSLQKAVKMADTFGWLSDKGWKDKLFSKYVRTIGSPHAITAFAASSMGSFVFSHMLSRAAKTTKVKDIRADAFWHDAGSLVSRYDPRTSSADFPKVSFHRVNSYLTAEQQRRWWDIANQMVDPTDLHKLAIRTKNVDLASDSFVTTYEKYLLLSRRIGIYSKGSGVPPKYEKMYALMKKVGFKRIVIFSDMKGATAPLMDFLALKDIACSKLSGTMLASEKSRILNQFSRGTLDVLVLSRDMYFGISIKGARQLHVMEPILDGVTRNQLYGRVSRYKSHEHLPSSERVVDIYIHVAVMPTGPFADLLRIVNVSLVQFVKHDAHKFPGLEYVGRMERGESFPQLGTPDELVYNISKIGSDVVTSELSSLPCAAEHVCRSPPPGTKMWP